MLDERAGRRVGRVGDDCGRADFIGPLEKIDTGLDVPAMHVRAVSLQLADHLAVTSSGFPDTLLRSPEIWNYPP
jgi:hypothetical protein